MPVLELAAQLVDLSNSQPVIGNVRSRVRRDGPGRGARLQTARRRPGEHDALTHGNFTQAKPHRSL